MTEIKKLYPTAEELNSVKINVKCTVLGCTSVFLCESNLQMHLIKHHNREDLKRVDHISQFYCPDISCAYNDKKHFKKLKYLKQHYLKLHADKNFICENCKKGFSTMANKNKHTESCGIPFKCMDCDNYYSAYESLLTHCRRKQHKVFNKLLYTNPTSIPQIKCVNKSILIFPKIILQKIVCHDKEIQTDPWIEPRVKQKCCSTQHTQTFPRKKIRKSAETQTMGQCVLKKNELNIHNKCIETQTHCDAQEKNLEEKHLKHDINLYNFFEDSTFNTCETQTDVMYQDTFLESNVFTSHIETQTNIDLDLCSNTYTQTCNDLLFPEFGFNDIQTQTNWPDYDFLVSTETQTQNTEAFLSMTLNREISHMETQTDTVFKQLLEEINA